MKKSDKKKGKMKNPFRPGAGHKPPHLAGRKREIREFVELLDQEVITTNVVLTGLRGVGKTVLLDILKPIAQSNGWLWVGTDLSESSSLSEETIAKRLITDLSPLTAEIVVGSHQENKPGFERDTETHEFKLEHHVLQRIYDTSPGMPVDKLMMVFRTVQTAIERVGKSGIIFAYDEAQTMVDHVKEKEFPLALLLQAFQSVQRMGAKFMLVLTGLPTLFSNLVESRTYAERMFHTIFLDRLNKADSKEAIVVPVKDGPFSFTDESVETIVNTSGGYPYFLQFICREVYDLFIAGVTSVPIAEILTKLDADFFSGRWQRLTDRQRELLWVAAHLENCDSEFTVQEIADSAKESLSSGFTPSHVNQMLASLCEKGLVFKNRHGRYSFAVPLLDGFIRRQVRPG